MDERGPRSEEGEELLRDARDGISDRWGAVLGLEGSSSILISHETNLISGKTRLVSRETRIPGVRWRPLESSRRARAYILRMGTRLRLSSSHHARPPRNKTHGNCRACAAVGIRHGARPPPSRGRPTRRKSVLRPLAEKSSDPRSLRSGRKRTLGVDGATQAPPVVEAGVLAPYSVPCGIIYRPHPSRKPGGATVGGGADLGNT